MPDLYSKLGNFMTGQSAKDALLKQFTQPSAKDALGLTSGVVPKPDPGSLQELALAIRQENNLGKDYDDADVAASYLQEHPETINDLNPQAKAIAQGLLDKGNIAAFYGQFGETIPATSLAKVPAFLQPVMKKYNANVVMGNPFTNTAAHVLDLYPHTIAIDRPRLVDQPTLSHEATHVFQNALQEGVDFTETPIYDYGGWEGLVQARTQGKTIRDFTGEQQAEMVDDYQRLQERVRDVASGKSKENQKDLLNEWDLAQRALGPFIKQLAGLPIGEDESNTIDVRKAFPPPGPPPAALTGQAVPLPEMGGDAIDLNAVLSSLARKR